MENLNAYKVLRLLFDLVEDQEGVKISFTLKEKEKEEKEGVSEWQQKK